MLVSYRLLVGEHDGRVQTGGKMHEQLQINSTTLKARSRHQEHLRTNVKKGIDSNANARKRAKVVVFVSVQTDPCSMLWKNLP